MKIEIILLDFNDDIYCQAVKLYAKGNTFEAEAKLKQFLRPYLVDQLGIVGKRFYDSQRSLHNLHSEVIIPRAYRGYDLEPEGFFVIDFDSILPKSDSLNMDIHFHLVENNRLEEMYVLCDAVLLDSGEREVNPYKAKNFSGTDLRQHFEHFGRRDGLFPSLLKAKHLGALVAGLDFMHETYKKIDATNLYQNTTNLYQLTTYRKGLLADIKAGILPRDNTEEVKAELNQRLARYEDTLRQFFQK